jgi:outer membrane protein assembly factor BamB
MKCWKTFIIASLSASVLGADWPQFRGPQGTGAILDETAPRELGADKVSWRPDLPGRGLSSPIVVADRVFVTASSGRRQDRLHVLAFDTRTGRELWHRCFFATGPTDSHPKSCMAAPTPVSYGRSVAALFGTGDLICLDFDGNVRWLRSLYEENPGAIDGRGLASSPVIAAGTLVVEMENQNTSFACGIDLQTGASRWRIDRPREVNWTTPLVLPGNTPAETLAFLQGSTRLSACDPATGREVWFLERKSHPIASSTLAGNVLLVPGEAGLMAFELHPNRVAPKLIWEAPRLNPSTASPVVMDGRVYSLRGAMLVSGDLKTGQVIGQLRLKGEFSSSPVAAGGRLFCFNEDGAAFVIGPGAKDALLLANGAMGETILATPAIAEGALYIRSDNHLWKIAKSPGSQATRDRAPEKPAQEAKHGSLTRVGTLPASNVSN